MLGSAQVYDTTPYLQLTTVAQRTVEQWGLRFVNYPFLAEFTMYFTTDLTGYHQFIFESIDDGAMVFLGNGAFGCCDNTEILGGQADAEILWAYKYNATSEPDTQSTAVYLQKGIYYPLRIVYINISEYGLMEFQIINPLGRNIELENHLFVLPGNVNRNLCSTTTGQLQTATVTCTNGCTQVVTITTERVISTESTFYTVPQVVITTPPLSTFTTTVPCSTCTGPVTITTDTVITTGTAPVTLPQVIVSIPFATVTTTVTCVSCSVPITSTLTAVVSLGSEIFTDIVVVIITPPPKYSSYAVVSTGLHFSNTTMETTLYQSFSSSIHYAASHIYSSFETLHFPSTTDIMQSSIITQPVSSVSTIFNDINTQTIKTSDINTVIESLPQITKLLSLLPPVVASTDVPTVGKTVERSTTTDSVSFLVLESYVVITSSISFISVSTASILDSESSIFSIGAGTELESQGEYITLTSVFSLQSDIALTTPYGDQTQSASVSGTTKPNVSLSSSFSSDETIESPTDYTEGSASRKSTSIFKYLFAVIFVILII
ncbi:hypothetical protein B5S33_g4668 [[Candida] boidinii]|nr:hypothetical protein B5S33_g4668 [[Candida] boidinii]